MYNTKTEQARAWLSNVVTRHVPINAKSYRGVFYDPNEIPRNCLGMQVDKQPVEGKVVELTDVWILLKQGRKYDFFLMERKWLRSVPGIGDTVRITPYARRGFHGERLDKPSERKLSDGISIKSYTIGENISPLPIDKKSLQCSYLCDLIAQVENLKTRDGIRTLAQVMIDAGAIEGLEHNDPADKDVIDSPPSLTFRVSTAKHDGYLSIIYRRGPDLYEISLLDRESRQALRNVDGLYFDDLGDTIMDLIDDGSWRFAAVEVLKPNRGRVRAVTT